MSGLIRPTGEDDAYAALERIVDAFSSLQKVGLFHAGVIVDVNLTTSNTEVRHALDRVPTIWLPLSLNANATVFCDTGHASPREYINLRASATVRTRVLIA